MRLREKGCVTQSHTNRKIVSGGRSLVSNSTNLIQILGKVIYKTDITRVKLYRQSAVEITKGYVKMELLRNEKRKREGKQKCYCKS